MAKRTNTKDWSNTDKRYGWKYGCDGFVNQTQAAEFVGRSQPWMSGILKSEERKQIGGKGYPIRAGREPGSLEWAVCIRSLNEFLKLRQPVEI